ncbi:LacI family DNA-binding transcriptional regulator [Aneurinibacillus sp. Ricciae_BoGa-3]|uniref:LacI family DNA-binding transcriptional regulator n=1 Tax=Aneurinibacillus sp. Ricciae_BoGa-3 TaxID=3022697 RepID=UPI0023413C26|nr:LacI family DNA-binding transcriptional regulator [Aneurinibacillus sp. Ricciae_BoGa-3]WCK53205.1 LacI family DNA-binding transcriptional regulator [Aneurinibacillus sp. Ricciae_BoGa-3]
MGKKLTINDIAKMAGVSRQTISRVLNNKEEVSEGTRKQVLRIIEEHGFQPSLQARSMVTRKTNTIALLLPDIKNPFFAEIVYGIERTLRANNMNLFLFTTDEDVEHEVSCIKLAQNYNVDGMILCSPRLDDANLRKMITKISPIVLLNRDLEAEGVSSVMVDAKQGGYTAAKYLIEQGHSRIGIIVGPPLASSSAKRLDGYKKALQEYGISIDEDLIVSVEVGDEGVHKLTQQLIRRNVTAITTYNDISAAYVIQACRDLNVEVPDDISVVGFDGIVLSQVMTPSLTTMALPLFEIGDTIANILLRMIKGSDGIERLTTVYPLLKEGNSTKSISLSY